MRPCSVVGYGPWSDPRAFTVDITDRTLGTPQPLSPIDAIVVTSPTFAWAAVSGAMSYRLSIRSNDGPAVHWWFPPPAAGCLASELCSAAPQEPPSGSAEWQIQAWSVNGHGGWSAPSALVVNTRAPSAPTLLSPSGATGATPPFVWNASADVVWFYIEIHDATGLRVGRWVRPDQVGCPNGIGVCTVNAGITLGIGAGGWRVIAWNPTGYGPWSDTMTFVRAN